MIVKEIVIDKYEFGEISKPDYHWDSSFKEAYGDKFDKTVKLIRFKLPDNVDIDRSVIRESVLYCLEIVNSFNQFNKYIKSDRTMNMICEFTTDDPKSPIIFQMPMFDKVEHVIEIKRRILSLEEEIHRLNLELTKYEP